ncbi:MAG: HD domain-containing protein [Bacteroidales bacterium]|jgi:uncharacterized protein
MDPYRIIAKYYQPGSLAFRILQIHSEAVAKKACHIAGKLNFAQTDIEFIREASLLHDIGILFTDAPEIGCFGELPYICHGYKGHDLLLSVGLPKHALVCERHTGAGLTPGDIDKFGGLLPQRQMEPISIEEKVIAYCDKFFSKDSMDLCIEKPFESVLESISRYGEEKGKIFREWHRQFNL